MNGNNAPQVFRYVISVDGTTGKSLTYIVSGLVWQYCKVLVDWGDGLQSDYRDTGYDQEPPYYRRVSHTYASAGEYIVTFFYDADQQAVNTDLISAFSNTSSFNSIISILTPLPSLFSLVEDVGSMFRNCRRLTSVPGGLFNVCTGITTFSATFIDCVSLASIPSNLFDGFTQAMDFQGCFSGCSGITSAVPELWVSYPSADGTQCFHYCTNAANYADIPSAWR